MGETPERAVEEAEARGVAVAKDAAATITAPKQYRRFICFPRLLESSDGNLIQVLGY